MLKKIKEWFFKPIPDPEEFFKGVEIVDDPVPLLIRKIGEKIMEKGNVRIDAVGFTIYRCDLVDETPQVTLECVPSLITLNITIDSFKMDIINKNSYIYLANCLFSRYKILNADKIAEEKEEAEKKLAARKELEKAVEQWS